MRAEGDNKPLFKFRVGVRHLDISVEEESARGFGHSLEARLEKI